MNEATAKIKQQIIDKIKSATNILITVSRDPTVDDLSAMLGLAAILNKMGKHATAIFSGIIPPAISFLEPDKTIENSADSLRDFIIALDKEKADHLRYKIEGDVVKIFITPYRTNISSADLEFSQGDYNIELVLALGVVNQEHLDQSLTAHGNVLADVTVVTLTAGQEGSQLGDLIWNEKEASSLSEMVANMGQSFKAEKTLLDKQIATALLTGIVAATDRFGNPRTTPAVMTLAAQLMAAGADTQLIAAKLREAHAINSLTPNPTSTNVVVSEPVAEVAPVEAIQTEPTLTPEPVSEEPVIENVSTLPDGNFTIQHDESLPSSTDDNSYSTLPPEYSAPDQPLEMPLEQSPMSTLPQATVEVPTSYEVQTPDNSMSTIAPQDSIEQSIFDTPFISGMPVEPTIQPAVNSMPIDMPLEPSLGGTLSATTDQAAEDARRELESQQNKTILSHSYLDDSGILNNSQINGVGQPEDTKMIDIFESTSPTEQATSFDTPAMPTPFVQAPQFEMPLPPPPPLPDFSTMTPPMPPQFDVPTISPASSASFSQQPSQQDDDPTQFKIPGSNF